MDNWTPGSFLLALTLAILVPALVVHFTLGRKGGHHLFKDVPQEKIRDLPFEMMRFKIRNNLRGSLATLAGLGAALALYPLACKLGFPLNVFGLSDQQFTFAVILGVGLLIIVGLAIAGKQRNK